jgi:L-threonylcarbamoyladenylate synthase
VKTQILQSTDLSLAIQSLKDGDPVAFPTETVYGLGACVFQESSVRKIFEIKGRPSDNPLIAHIASLDEAFLLGEQIHHSFFILAEAFWPGPLTIVVNKHSNVPDLVSAGHPTIAIRMPSHPVAIELIKGVGTPLVAPSANLSGKPSPTRATDVLNDLEGRVRYIIDGGQCMIGIESTVISLVHQQPTILRPGKVTQEELEKVLKTKLCLPQIGGPILSPGMKYRHYAPKVYLEL